MVTKTMSKKSSRKGLKFHHLEKRKLQVTISSWKPVLPPIPTQAHIVQRNEERVVFYSNVQSIGIVCIFHWMCQYCLWLYKIYEAVSGKRLPIGIPLWRRDFLWSIAHPIAAPSRKYSSYLQSAQSDGLLYCQCQSYTHTLPRSSHLSFLMGFSSPRLTGRMGWVASGVD